MTENGLSFTPGIEGEPVSEWTLVRPMDASPAAPVKRREHKPMPPAERVRALNAAAIQLDWLTDTEGSAHGTRYDAARLVLADTDTRATIASGSGGDGEGRRPKGEHSDPTGRTAVKHVDVAIDARTTARDLHLCVVDLAETARYIRSAIAGAPHTGPDTLSAAQSDLAWSLTIWLSSPHAGTWRSDDAALVEETDHAIGHIVRESTLLAGKVAVILRSAVRPPETKPEQKPLDGCRSCARWGLQVANDRYAHRCRRCGDFQKEWKCMPTEQICRAWDTHGNRARITPGMILEAQAQRSAKKAKGRKSA